MCGNSIYKTYQFFHLVLKKGNSHLKEKSSYKSSKEILENYRPVGLLPTYGKIFEHLMLNDVFEFSIENNLIPFNQLVLN